MKTDQVHVVRQGECLSGIAQQYGFANWRILYDHPSNAELKKRRPNPNALLPGDLVAIPERKPTTAERATGQWHEFTVEPDESRLRVQLLGPDGKPLANQDYELTASGNTRHGTTDGDGLVDEPFDHRSRTAVLKANVPIGDETREIVWNFDTASLDPISSTSGLQARLANLGYYSGAIDGSYGPATRSAVMAFQDARGLEPTGVADDATRAELEKQHDSVT